MPQEQDRAARKAGIVARMMKLEQEELQTAEAHHAAFVADARLGGREGHDRDELVAARENADLAAAFDHPVQAHHAKIDAIENADFSVTDVVRPGAVVSFGGRHVVALVSTGPFDCDGVAYMGISTASPIYQAMDGLEAGDSFVLNGREITIEDVM
jgi:transcription elongation GreA/GreB family factor